MDPQHDEINLVRLVRRLEKSVADANDWKPNASLREEEIWLKAQKSLQNAKFARNLVKNIEADEFELPPNRVQQINDIKIKLDSLDMFLKDTQQACYDILHIFENSYKPISRRPDPILPTLPVPVEPPTAVGIPPSDTSTTQEPQNSLASLNPDEISPTLITTALPSLLPSYPPETATATTSSFARNFGGVHGSTALHEELSSQLEQMAQQLKRNALHFSSSLEKDKAVVEDTQLKLEGNYDVMQKERVRLRDHSGKSSSTTWMVVGIVVLVLVLFVLMVGVIRFL
ncbi:hypothetical protein CPB84DRAFT_1813428 [Gymnopilus junonius]|uniref:Uncharacterized protein n=1 Tax=Gymnopilus junonius TaxID=109634 RepID=A0A9P5TQP0_GYMJU|nr:hypothetical protein CPB84DRAFT_1813428 [Gymnopilus junonius]